MNHKKLITGALIVGGVIVLYELLKSATTAPTQPVQTVSTSSPTLTGGILNGLSSVFSALGTTGSAATSLSAAQSTNADALFNPASDPELSPAALDAGYSSIINTPDTNLSSLLPFDLSL